MFLFCFFFSQTERENANLLVSSLCDSTVPPLSLNGGPTDYSDMQNEKRNAIDALQWCELIVKFDKHGNAAGPPKLLCEIIEPEAFGHDKVVSKKNKDFHYSC